MGWLEGYQPSCCLLEDDVYTTRKAESQRSPRSPKEPWQQQTLLILLCDVMNCLQHFESQFFFYILQQSCTLIPKEFHIGKQLLKKTSEVLDGQAQADPPGMSPRSCKTDPLLELLFCPPLSGGWDTGSHPSND